MTTQDDPDDTSAVLLIRTNPPQDSAQQDTTEAFIFRTRGQSEDEPLRLELAVKEAGSDDTTDETCEHSSHSSEPPDEEMGEAPTRPAWVHDLMWLTICFVGIMASFVAYGILLEYVTSGEQRLHERT